VRVTWDRGPQGMVVEVADDGRFEREPAGDHLGMGLAIAARVVDEMTIKPGSQKDPGTVVRLVKKTGRVWAAHG
jgi:anti-sigma regulatory factor (Ser/Thr protein kinase)